MASISMTVRLIHLKFIHFVFQHCDELNRDWNLAMELMCQEEYNNTQKQDTFISSNNVTALNSLHIMFGSTYWTTALHLILLRPSMSFPRHPILQFTMDNNSDYHKMAKTAGFFDPSNMLSNIPEGSLLFNIHVSDQEIESDANKDVDLGDPHNLFACQLIPSSLDQHQKSEKRSGQDVEDTSDSGEEYTPRDSSLKRKQEEMTGTDSDGDDDEDGDNSGDDDDDEDIDNSGGDDDDDDDEYIARDTSSKRKGKGRRGRKSKSKKPKSAEFISDTDDEDQQMESIDDQELYLMNYHNMISFFRTLMRSCASFQVRNSETDIHGHSVSVLDHRDVLAMSTLFGRLITNPDIRLAARDEDFVWKADTMLSKFAQDSMGEMSGKEKTDLLKRYDVRLTNIFQQEDHPTCEEAVVKAVKVLEDDWQMISDQYHNQDNEMDLDNEDVEMED